jgi:nucleoside-diphosphate-sugar epimerase
VFNVNSGEAATARAFFAHYARAVGKPVRFVPDPVVAAAVVAATGLRRAGVAVPFSGDTVEYVTHPGSYSIERITRVTGWRPAVGIDEGMRRTLAWLREEGML